MGVLEYGEVRTASRGVWCEVLHALTQISQRSADMRSVAYALILLSSSCAWASARAQEPGCRPADADSQSLLLWVRHVATGIDSLSALDRTRFRIPGATMDQIELVLDADICQAAAAAFSAAEGSAPVGGRKVNVVRVDRRYVVSDPLARLQEFSKATVFDSDWKVLTRILN